MTPRFVEANGERLAVWEWPGEGRPIVFVHATGFHARCWLQVIARLPGRRSIAIDMRGHGESSKPPEPYAWRRFGEDVAAVARELRLRGAIGAGHSMGGHSLLLAAILDPALFGELVLLDPVILPPDHYRGPRREPHFARKRRNRWTSPAEMCERFRERPPFSEWDPAVLRDYCEYGLRPDGDGYLLACPPWVEGSIYENSSAPEANLHAQMEQVRIPVTVVRSMRGRLAGQGPMDMAASPTAPDLASRLPRGRDIEVPCSHFIPMEAPALAAHLISGAGPK